MVDFPIFDSDITEQGHDGHSGDAKTGNDHHKEGYTTPGSIPIRETRPVMDKSSFTTFAEKIKAGHKGYSGGSKTSNCHPKTGQEISAPIPIGEKRPITGRPRAVSQLTQGLAGLNGRANSSYWQEPQLNRHHVGPFIKPSSSRNGAEHQEPDLSVKSLLETCGNSDGNNGAGFAFSNRLYPDVGYRDDSAFLVDSKYPPIYMDNGEPDLTRLRDPKDYAAGKPKPVLVGFPTPTPSRRGSLSYLPDLDNSLTNHCITVAGVKCLRLNEQSLHLLGPLFSGQTPLADFSVFRNVTMTYSMAKVLPHQLEFALRRLGFYVEGCVVITTVPAGLTIGDVQKDVKHTLELLLKSPELKIDHCKAAGACCRNGGC